MTPRLLLSILPSATAMAGLLIACSAQAGTNNGFGVAVSATAQNAYWGNQTVSAYRKLPDASGNWSTTADVPGVQQPGCQDVAPHSGFSCFTTASGTGGGSGTNYDLTFAVAHASRSDDVSYEPRTFATGVASARADLARGEIGVSASSDKYRSVLSGATYNAGLAYAHLNDTLTFQVAGASADTVTRIQVGFDLDGSLSAFPAQPGVASIDDLFHFGGASARYQASIGMGSPSPVISSSGWLSQSWEETGLNSIRFVGEYALIGEMQVVGISNRLAAYAGQGAVADFLNTSSIVLDLPSGVVYTSSSGVFLTSAVPEPQAWALMLGGLLALGAVVRQRRNNR